MGLLEIKSIYKSYGGVQALENVSFDIHSGSIHSICGENGAGKSTLIKCLSGNVIYDRGQIILGGRELSLGIVQRSEEAGIAVIHQESTVFPDLNSIQNIFVGRELSRFGGIILDHHAMREKSKYWLGKLGQDFDIDVPVENLSHAERQMVAMARSLSSECKILILDEPTASLSPKESNSLISILKKLKSQGVTIIYISHRLDEVLEISDSITVLRDGTHIETSLCKEFSKDRLIQLMVGRELDLTPKQLGKNSPQAKLEKPLLEVSNLTSKKHFHDISFKLFAGKITGLSGLVGAGRSELARSIIGADSYDSGFIKIDGKELGKSSIQASLQEGLVMVPEDRQHEGLVLLSSTIENTCMAVENKPSQSSLFISKKSEEELTNQNIEKLKIKANDPRQPVELLSGGNQQKVVLAKWLATKPKILLLDEPTRGVDVGAKEQVHQIIEELAQSGLAILVISSDLQEIIHISDRVLVMREGRINAELTGTDIHPEEIMRHAFESEINPQFKA